MLVIGHLCCKFEILTGEFFVRPNWLHVRSNLVPDLKYDRLVEKKKKHPSNECTQVSAVMNEKLKLISVTGPFNALISILA